MPYVLIDPAGRAELQAVAEARWTNIVADRPQLEGAVELQRKLIARVIGLRQTVEAGRLPRLSLPGKYVAAKLARGVPALSVEPIPLPVQALTGVLISLCGELAAGGAGEVAEHIRSAIESRQLDAGSLLAASLSRDQGAIRSGAAHRGLAPDLVWLVAELAVGPFAYALQRSVFADAGLAEQTDGSRPDNPVRLALHGWNHGYCPACRDRGPRWRKSSAGHRALCCSFCAAAVGADNLRLRVLRRRR